MVRQRSNRGRQNSGEGDDAGDAGDGGQGHITGPLVDAYLLYFFSLIVC